MERIIQGSISVEMSTKGTNLYPPICATGDEFPGTAGQAQHICLNRKSSRECLARLRKRWPTVCALSTRIH